MKTKTLAKRIASIVLAMPLDLAPAFAGQRKHRIPVRRRVKNCLRLPNQLQRTKRETSGYVFRVYPHAEGPDSPGMGGEIWSGSWPGKCLRGNPRQERALPSRAGEHPLRLGEGVCYQVQGVCTNHADPAS